MVANQERDKTRRVNQAFELDPCSQQCIRAFLNIFLQLPGFRDAPAAAAYYTAIIQLFCRPYKQINRSVRSIYQALPPSLLTGRDDLLNYGFLAKIYLADDAEFRNRFEDYLPVNPELILEIKGKQMHICDEDKIAIKKLSNIYTKNFGANGLATKKGRITALYNSRWLYYTLMNNVKNNKLFLMTFGKLRSFDRPYLDFYLKMFEEGLEIKGIYNTNDENLKKKALDLNSEYSKNIKIKFTDIDTIALRRLIANKIAIDARKVIGSSETKPSYIGTLYLEKKSIDYFRDNFDELYRKSSEN